MQLSPKETAALLNVSERTIKRWVNRRALPAQHLQERLVFNRLELLEWSQATGINPPRPSQGFLASDALLAGGLLPLITSNDPLAVLAEASANHPLPAIADRALLGAALKARLKLSPSPAAGGLLLPQARKPLIVALTAPCLSVSYLNEPVDFGAADGQPITAVVLLSSPSVRCHIDLLSQLNWAFRVAGFRQLLKERASNAELLQALRLAEQAANEEAGN